MYKKSPIKLWRKFKNRYALKGTKSETTNKVYYPPVQFESTGMNQQFSEYSFKKKGKLITWSMVNSAPNGFESFKPYIIAIIELEGGEKMTSQVVDVEIEKLKKGDTLIPTFRKIYTDGEDGIIHYGIKWTKA